MASPRAWIAPPGGHTRPAAGIEARPRRGLNFFGVFANPGPGAGAMEFKDLGGALTCAGWQLAEWVHVEPGAEEWTAELCYFRESDSSATSGSSTKLASPAAW